MIDTHTHLYDPSRLEGVPWPPPDDLIYAPTRPDRLMERAVPAGVVGTIVVECSPWLEDNQWVLDLAEDEPFILGLVGNLDLHDPKILEHLDRFAKNPVFRGIRAGLRDRDDLSGLHKLADLGLSLDGGLDDQTCYIASQIPDLRIIINHCAGLGMDGDDPDLDQVDRVRKAAEYPNVVSVHLPG